MLARNFRTTALTGAILASGMLAHAGIAAAQGVSDDVIRIGFITDMSGVYSDVDGHADRFGSPGAVDV